MTLKKAGLQTEEWSLRLLNRREDDGAKERLSERAKRRKMSCPDICRQHKQKNTPKVQTYSCVLYQLKQSPVLWFDY